MQRSPLPCVMSSRVYGQGHHHPYYPPPPPPPPPPKSGLSPLVIVLLVLGGTFVLGAGACVAIGAFAFVAANASADPDEDKGADGNGGALTTPGTPTGTPLDPLDEDDDLPTGDEPATEDGDDSAGGAESSPSSAAGTNGAATAAPTSGAATGGGSWWCTASASVRVCGFAGACNYQMVFGNGSGKDRFLASQQAKHACEASARAKGAVGVCIVQCSPR